LHFATAPEVNKDISVRNTKRNEIESFLKLLGGRDVLLTEFDESLGLGSGSSDEGGSGK